MLVFCLGFVYAPSTHAVQLSVLGLLIL
jgi:hypothetical protein